METDGSTADRGTDRPVWIGGLVAVCAGGVLALLGLTLPWASVETPEGGEPGLYSGLGDLHPAAGPAAALLLILAAAGAAAGFASARRPATPARWFAVAVASAGAVVALFLTLYRVDGSDIGVRSPLYDLPLPITAGDVGPAVGCVLYVCGLFLLAIGAGLGDRLPRGAGDQLMRGAGAAGRSVAHRAVVAVALFAAALSAVLPWDRVEPGPEGSTLLNPLGPGLGDVRVWLATYRIGLIVGLALVVAGLLLPGAVRRLRVAGQVVTVAVTAALVTGLALLRWPQRTVPPRYGGDFATLHLGAGYVAGLAAMAWLAVGFFVLPARATIPGPPAAAGPLAPAAHGPADEAVPPPTG